MFLSCKILLPTAVQNRLLKTGMQFLPIMFLLLSLYLIFTEILESAKVHLKELRANDHHQQGRSINLTVWG
jgi:hypothetical protein